MTTLYPNSEAPTHGVFVENRLRQLMKSGQVEATVIAPVPWFPFAAPAFGRYGQMARVPSHETRHGLQVAHPRFPVIPKVGMSLAPLLLYWGIRRHVRQALRDGQGFDLIDAHYVYPDGVAAAWLGASLGKPVVVTARGTDLNLIAGLPGPARQISEMFRHIDGLITVSTALGERAHSLGMPADRIAVLRNGVDADQFTITDPTRWRSLAGDATAVILSVGNLIAAKGHHLVIRALARLDGVHLLIAGNGPDRQALETLARDLSVADRVHFLGTVPHHELAAVYSAADLLVLASEREGWPNVLLESMACGTPVVATRVGGVPEIVTAPAAGLLIDERNDAAIADAARALLANLPSRDIVRAHALRYGWEETVSSQLDLYRAIVEGRYGEHR